MHASAPAAWQCNSKGASTTNVTDTWSVCPVVCGKINHCWMNDQDALIPTPTSLAQTSLMQLSVISKVSKINDSWLDSVVYTTHCLEWSC